MIFMGEEWAAATPWQFFASFPDQELAEAVRTGRREEFAAHGWGAAEVPDPMDPATVRRAVLRWSELSDQREVFDTYRALIALRRAHPELADPRLDRFTVDGGDGWLVLRRGTLRVVVNLGPRVTIALGGEIVETLLSANDPTANGDTILAPSDSFAIVRVSGRGRSATASSSSSSGP
jgi:maltooligosyltrehalose trehalohydrolase